MVESNTLHYKVNPAGGGAWISTWTCFLSLCLCHFVPLWTVLYLDTYCLLVLRMVWNRAMDTSVRSATMCCVTVSMPEEKGMEEVCAALPTGAIKEKH